MTEVTDSPVGWVAEHTQRYLDTGGEDAVRIVAFARENDRAIHLVHLSTAAELNLIDPVHGDLPVTAGCFATSASASRFAAFASPPAAAISPAAMPCSSSSSAFSKCAGAIRC